MAYPTDSINTNRKTTNVLLPPQLSSEILEKTIHESAIMRLAERVALPGNGITIQVITGDPVADWTAETAEKPVSNPSFGTKNMTPYKLAVIELFSNEFRRDKNTLYEALRRRLPLAIGKKFDETIFHGSAPGSGFDVLTNVDAVALDAQGSSMYAQLVAAMSKIAKADRKLNGWAISPSMTAELLLAVDGVNRPLFIQSVNSDNSVGSILGSRTFETPYVYDTTESPAVVGFAGDWTQARYGVVDGINIEISDQATINDGSNQINLWQRNMFAVRCECSVGFIYTDEDAFIKLTHAEDSASE